VSWTSSNATSCDAVGGWTTKSGTSGSDSVGPLNFTTAFEMTCTGSGGSETDAVTVSVQNQQAPDLITTVTLDDGGSGSNRSVTFGLPFAEGAVPDGTDLVLTSVGGGTVYPTQWSQMKLWRTAVGGQMHGIMTAKLPGSGNNSGRYEVRVGTQTGGANISKADVVSSGFDAQIKAVTGGGTYSLNAADLLSNSVTPLQNHTHFAGPLASEFIVGGPLRVNGNGNAHPYLTGYFHVRAFNRPVSRVYVTMVIENTAVFRAAPNVSADVTMSIDGTNIENRSNFSVHADKRYPARGWWGGDPDMFVHPGGEYMQDTAVFDEYVDEPVTESMLSGFPKNTNGWNGAAFGWRADMEGTGAGPHIGALDRYSSAYLMSDDVRAWNAVRAVDDQKFWITTTKNFAQNPRDETTGWPLDLSVKPNSIGTGWGSSAETGGMVAKRVTTSPVRQDMAHQVSCPYVSYVVTGEFGYLEQCQLWHVANWTNERPGSYAGWNPRRWYSGQVRANGWGIRNVILGSVVTPDDHPLAAALDEGVVNALESWDEYRNLQGGQLTGMLLNGDGTGSGNAFPYKPSGTPNPNDGIGSCTKGGGSSCYTGTGPWQQAFATYGFGIAYERGWKAELDANGLWAWKAQFITGILGGGDGYCWNQSSVYAIGMMDETYGPKYTTWKQIYDKNFPNEGSCPPAGAPMANSDNGPSSRASNLHPGAAIAVNTGIPGAVQSWIYLRDRQKSWYTPDAPEFAIMPRQ
jgi:hypothetical protein